MSYSINGKIYTSHALMDEIIFNTKVIIKDLILKNEKLADSYETTLSIQEADYYVACKNGTMELSFFPLTKEILIAYGCTELQAAKWVEDRTRIPEELQDEVLAFCCQYFIDHYIEYNDYYRMLNGQPEYSADHPDDYNVTLSKYDYYTDDGLKHNQFDDLFAKDFSETAFDFNAPLHTFTINEINTLDGIGVMDAIRKIEITDKTDLSTKTVIDPDGKARVIEDQAKHYKYLNYLGDKQINIYNARVAANWDILYLPSVEYLVQDKFMEFYKLNRDIYERRTYQLAYQESSDYFEEIIILLIIGQTFADMITDTPEWYIRRDVFDLRTVQYFLTSQGVKFFEDIPMRYQIRIVKNLNKLIKYKSTDKNIFDILELFNVNGVVLYKYYIMKNYLYTDNREYVVIGETEPEWSMEAEYDFGFEDTDDIGDTGDGEGHDVPGSEVYDFVDITDEDYIDPDADYDYYYDFRSEDPDYWDEYWSQYEEMLPEYDFYDEDAHPDEINNTSIDGIEDNITNELYDFGFLDPSVIENYDERVAIYDFENEGGYIVPETEETDRHLDYQERIKEIRDEFGNVFELQFVKAPIGEEYDDYIKDTFYREPYDDIVKSDEYWDGEDTHNYIRNNHLRKDFTIEGTKYIGLEYNVDLQESLYEKEYYLGTLLNARIDTKDVILSIPQLSNKKFTLLNILLFVYCLNGVYTNTNIPVQDATLAVTRRNKDKPEFDPYTDYEGGFPWTDPVEPQPEPEPEPFYGFDDYGFEDEDDIDPDTIEVIKDFGYNFTIDWTTVIYDNYDYGLITEDSEEDEYSPQPVEPAIIIPDFDYAFDAYVYVNPERPYYYCEQYYVDQTNGDWLLITKDFMDEHQELWDTYITIIYKWTMYTDRESFGYYTIDLDNHGPGDWNDKDQWEIELDGGHEPYSGRYTTHTFYDYIRTDHPDIYVDPVGRIYGFNMENSLEDIAEAIGFRHSEFGFERGYTLEDCGVANFISKKKFSDIDDFYNVYQTNTECYKTLVYKMQNANSRDERRVLEYVFMKLYTLPWDTEFYILQNGEMATSYDQILKEKDYNLYLYYVQLLNEGDSNLRIFNTRNVLNNIADTLNYFIHGDNLQYVLSFIATMSYDAVLHYVFEMVNFFKSWKMHFLDPKLSYFLDCKNENSAGYGDQIATFKIDYWTPVNAKTGDALTITPLYYVEEIPGKDPNSNIEAELTEIHSHYVDHDILSDKLYDGGGPEDQEEYYDLNGGGVHELTEEQLQYAIDNEIAVCNTGCDPFYQVDCGEISANHDLFDIDGGGAMDAPSYLTIDGGNITDIVLGLHKTPIFTTEGENIVTADYENLAVYVGFEDYGEDDRCRPKDFDVDGGRPNIHYILEKGIAITIDKYNQIRSDIILAPFLTNGLEIEDDGIYFDKTPYASKDQVRTQRNQTFSFHSFCDTEMHNLKARADILNPANFKVAMENEFRSYLAGYYHIRNTVTDEYMDTVDSYRQVAKEELYEWFAEEYTERYSDLWENLEPEEAI